MPLDKLRITTSNIVAFFDNNCSWLTSCCPSACVDKEDVFYSFPSKEDLLPK